ncbi:circadian clock KaiB family protein [Hymenobacter cavernae]|nr:circadian clock KaiB family protein [Hymenobacter cavernae]
MELKLFVAGDGPRSRQAIETIQGICDEHLAGRCKLTIIDLQQHPEEADKENIVALPTLLKVAPLPVCRLIGALAVKSRVLAGLGIDAGGTTT